MFVLLCAVFALYNYCYTMRTPVSRHSGGRVSLARPSATDRPQSTQFLQSTWQSRYSLLQICLLCSYYVLPFSQCWVCVRIKIYMLTVMVRLQTTQHARSYIYLAKYVSIRGLLLMCVFVERNASAGLTSDIGLSECCLHLWLCMPISIIYAGHIVCYWIADQQHCTN